MNGFFGMDITMDIAWILENKLSDCQAEHRTCNFTQASRDSASENTYLVLKHWLKSWTLISLMWRKARFPFFEFSANNFEKRAKALCATRNMSRALHRPELPPGRLWASLMIGWLFVQRDLGAVCGPAFSPTPWGTPSGWFPRRSSQPSKLPSMSVSNPPGNNHLPSCA